MSTLNIPGFVGDGDWLVSSKEVALRRRLCGESPPRSFGPLDQIKADLSQPHSTGLYVLVLGSFVYAGVSGRLGYALVGIVLIAMFGGSFTAMVGALRHGVLTNVRIARVQHDLGRNGVNENVVVDGAPANVSYELAPVRAILASGSDVELQVLVYTKGAKRIAHAIAYRPVT